MIEEILAGIFEKKRVPIKAIDFAMFNELIENSLFYQEFIRVVKTPLAELALSVNKSWEVLIN